MTREGIPEPGDVHDTTLGLTDEQAGHPSPEPPDNDQELGDAEELEGDPDDIDEEE